MMWRWAQGKQHMVQAFVVTAMFTVMITRSEHAVHRLRDEPEDVHGKCTALPRKQSLIIVARASVDDGYRRYDAHDCMHMQVT